MAEAKEKTAEEAAQAEQLEKSGMGAVPDEESDDSKDGEEKPEPKEEKQSKEADDDSEDESEEDDSEDEEADDEGDESEEEGEEAKDSKSKAPARTVPYGLLKAKNATIKALQAQLKEAKGKAEEAGDEEEVDDIDAMAEKLAMELGAKDIDKTRLAKILRAATELASKKSELPADIKEKLAQLEDIQKERKQTAETAHFEKEWNAILPDINKQFPNAPESVKTEAKKLMDELSHTKKFHDKDLDYVLFKNRAKFETILKVAAKGKSGESGKTIVDQKYEDSDDEEEMTDLENLTPEIMKQREAKSIDTRMKSGKDYRIQQPIK